MTCNTAVYEALTLVVRNETLWEQMHDRREKRFWRLLGSIWQLIKTIKSVLC